METDKGKGEIVVYQPDEVTRLEVRVEGETVWLNRHQLADLFGRDVKTIGKHINNALREELRSIPTVANFAIVQQEGARWVLYSVQIKCFFFVFYTNKNYFCKNLISYETICQYWKHTV